MNRVFVLSCTQKPLMPCHPARARMLLRRGRAAIYRRAPFTIILKDRADGATQPVEFKTDPGSKTTGIALVAELPRGREVIWAANLEHRGHRVRAALTDRRQFRRGRRGRNCRYRQARFDNRRRAPGWLPPSLRSRVDNVRTWYERLRLRSPITAAQVETVRFDTQAMQRPGIEGIEHQQGELAGYEIRQYVIDRGQHTCAYCGAKGVPLQIEHVRPRSRGGSNRVSNLVPACAPCNGAKNAQPLEVFLKDKPEVLRQVQAQLRQPLSDAAAVNATRYAIGEASVVLTALGDCCEFRPECREAQDAKRGIQVPLPERDSFLCPGRPAPMPRLRHQAPAARPLGRMAGRHVACPLHTACAGPGNRPPAPLRTYAHAYADRGLPALAFALLGRSEGCSRGVLPWVLDSSGERHTMGRNLAGADPAHH